MAVEIEAKMKVDDLAAVRGRLEASGAGLIGDYLECNVFFDTEDRSLLAADQGLRIRRSDDTRNGTRVCTMTFKGPRQHGALKSREETEITVGDFDGAGALLGCLGLIRVLSFEKRRQSWSLGGCRVELDEVPNLGAFVEIEGKREDAILHVRELLQLSSRPLIKASYIAMLMTFLQEHGQSGREIRFAAGDASQPVQGAAS
jgi:adenylate cyclase, class 2